MNMHPDVLWELVKDHQARLRVEAQRQNRARLLARVRPTGRSRAVVRAGTLAACEPGAVG